MSDRFPNLMSARRYAPATERNRDPILAVLKEILPETGTVLEISSGTGEHAAYFAPRLAPRHWLPSDVDPELLASIVAWADEMPSPNLWLPIRLNACDPVWAVEQPMNLPEGIDLEAHPIRAIANINMIHIAPWDACLGLMAGAQRILPPDGVLYLYGPFHQNGQPTSPSNAAFDESLQSQNPEWGVRDLETVIATAQNHGLLHQRTIAMPANNLSVIFRKAG